MRVFVTVVVLLLALSGQDPMVAQDLEEAPSLASAGGSVDLGGEEHFEPGEIFVNANTVYEAGEYERAVELYESLLDHGYENGYLRFNLGNAYLRNGELGQAIAAYRRSQVYLPRDQDVRANLEFARKSAKDALRPPAPDPVLATLFFWHYGLSRSELAVTVMVVNLLLWAVLILRLYRRGSEVLRWTFMVLLLLVLATLGSLGVHYLWPQEIAVIVPQEIEVRSGTNVHDVVLFKLHAGTEVRVVDRREGSIRIALPEEGKGGVDRAGACGGGCRVVQLSGSSRTPTPVVFPSSTTSSRRQRRAGNKEIAKDTEIRIKISNLTCRHHPT